jgi:hypothetical protein
MIFQIVFIAVSLFIVSYLPGRALLSYLLDFNDDEEGTLFDL